MCICICVYECVSVGVCIHVHVHVRVCACVVKYFTCVLVFMYTVVVPLVVIKLHSSGSSLVL